MQKEGENHGTIQATECQEEEIVSKTAGQTDGNAGEINPVARADLKDVADPKDVTDPKGVARSVCKSSFMTKFSFSAR